MARVRPARGAAVVGLSLAPVALLCPGRRPRAASVALAHRARGVRGDAGHRAEARRAWAHTARRDRTRRTLLPHARAGAPRDARGGAPGTRAHAARAATAPRRRRVGAARDRLDLGERAHLLLRRACVDRVSLPRAARAGRRGRAAGFLGARRSAADAAAARALSGDLVREPLRMARAVAADRVLPRLAARADLPDDSRAGAAARYVAVVPRERLATARARMAPARARARRERPIRPHRGADLRAHDGTRALQPALRRLL